MTALERKLPGYILSEEEKKETEQNTEEAINELSKKTPQTVQNGDNNQTYHIAGNGEINYMCKECLISELKRPGQSITSHIIEEYDKLLKVKDDEIAALKELNRLLKEKNKQKK